MALMWRLSSIVYSFEEWQSIKRFSTTFASPCIAAVSPGSLLSGYSIVTLEVYHPSERVYNMHPGKVHSLQRFHTITDETFPVTTLTVID